MKLGKQQEIEMMQAYSAYWKNYLKGDVKNMAILLAKGYTQVGSAESEVFFNKKDAVKFLRETIDQVAGKLEMRNRVIKPEQQGDFTLVHEQCDLYARDGKKWIFYAKFRASTLMEKKKDGWKLIHQHSSFPDTKTEAGQNIAIDKIAEENAQLREAVKRRTTELEQKNRELEIETALEKVRVVAMSMKHAADMPDICKAIAVQLKSLGVNEIRNVQTAIFYEDKGTYMNYEYYAKHDRTFITETSYTNHEMHQEFAAQMLKGKGEFFTTQIKGKKKLSDWIAYQKTTNVFIDPLIETAKSLNYYWYSLGPVALGTSTYQPLTENETSLFKRFLKVFELSYRRYLDIEKAEAQAREARIETALEKVRARTMGMQRSDELAETAVLLFHQLLSLDLELRGCGINIWEKDEKICTAWMSTPDGELMPPFQIPLTENPVFIRFYESRQNGEDFWVQESGEKELAARFQYLSSLPVISDLLTKDLSEDKEVPTFVIDHVVNFSYGNLIFITYKHCPEEWDTFKRFGKVFEQTYTRFLDLQKAEAQAKEAKIEASLERVRAVAMSMMKSVELLNVCEVLLNELKQLEFTDIRNTQIVVTNDSKESFMNYQFSDYGVNGVREIFYKGYFLITEFVEKIKKAGNAFVMDALSGAKLEAWKKYRNENGDIPDPKLDAAESLYYYWYSTGTGALGVSTFHPISNDQLKILQRFRNVFELSYKRYIDIEKAEQQAREAQIELALERVRARTMAMQHSGELQDAANLLFQQVKALGLPILTCGYNIWEKDEKVCTAWMSSEDGLMLPSFKIPLTESPFTIRFYESRQKGESFYAEEIEGEALAANYRYLMTLPGFAEIIDGFLKAGFTLPTFQINHVANFSHGNLIFISYQPVPEAWDIFKRFAKVFEQTYTRFLDLQKAEEQARESQIQLALERVRARTMAMQKSGELPEAANLLFQQMQALGMPAWSAGYCIWDDDKQGITLWMSSEGVMQPSFHMPLTVDPSLIHMKESYERSEPFHVEAVGGDDLVSHYRYMRTLPGIGEILDSIISEGHPLPTFQIFHCAYFSEGFLLFITYEPVPEAHDIFKRFGKVFDQTYTRFLDLQKAEAQAREARIETALERVRAKTMAMHKSDELLEVVNVLADQFVQLDFKFDNVSFGENNQDDDFKFWFIAAGQPQPLQIQVPYCDNPAPNRVKEAQQKGLKFFADVLSQEENRQWTQHLIDHSDVRLFPEKVKNYILNCDGYARSTSILKNINLYIGNYKAIPYSEEENNLFQRFAQVFEQSYTRFLDLKKAEAQAREAQIEAALENVRSRSLAMHQSDELQDIVNAVFERLKALNIEMNVTSIFIFKDGSKDWEQWVASADTDYSSYFHLPYRDNPIFNDLEDARKKGKDFYTVTYSYEQKNDWFNYAFLNTEYRRIPDARKRFLIESDFYKVAFALAKHTGLQLCRYSGGDFSESDHGIMKRFANVFEQAYVRFLDLQKAEAQSREAQIELALERVRAKTMAMHNSTDVGETAAVMVDELKKLGIETIRCGIGIMHEPGDMELWTIRTDDNKTEIIIGWLDMNMHPLLHGAFQSWRIKNESYSYELGGDDLLNYYNAINNYPGYPIRYDTSDLPKQIFHNEFHFAEGTLFAFSLQQLTDEQRKIFKRFAGVFGQTYRRYLDLKKAEAQARHAQIEAAMEKVRARSLAMQKPEELVEVAELLRKEMGSLGVEELETSSIYIVREPTETAECWYAIKDIRGENKQLVSDHMIINLQDTWVGREMLQFYGSGQKQISILMRGENRKEWINYCAQRSTVLQGYYGDEIPERTYHLVKFYNGYMGAASPGNISAESWDLLQRATAAFSFAYTRFQDLQHAAAREREAQIELALERVRARTMAMFKSDELAETAAVLFHQIIGLGIEPNRLYIGIIKDETGEIEAWATNEEGNKVSSRFILSSHRNNSVKKMYDGWTEQKKSITIDMHGKELEDYFQYLDNELHIPFSIGLHQKRRMQYIAYFSKGFIGIAAPEEQPQSTINLLERFASVFNLTYTRFNDLQKAEAQAREATVEAALEKVRGRAMAMHTSDDLSSTAAMVFTELRKLGINPIRSGVGLLKKDSRKAQLYSATSSSAGDSLSLVGWVLLSGHPVLENIYDSWIKNEEYFPVLTGEQLKSYYELLLAGLSVTVPDWQGGQKQYGHFLPSPVGCLYAWSETPYNEAELKIMNRFGTIIDLTFRRYIELQKSEASAREAVRQASLDRVRAEIASMRTTSDLERITPLIWNELMVLGVAFIRCGVFIMDELQQLIHTFLSTPDGKAIGAFHLPYTTQGNIAEVLAHWQQKENYIAHWNEVDFTEFADTLVKQGALSSSQQYLQAIPHSGFHLHFLPFLQGMLYVGNTRQLGEEEIRLVQSVADAFSTAYARYEDFNKLEAAKQTVEKTLVDLRQAQTQLVQAEKMASLGQLTAGIAHEIQNPLNFVNNFSEVSNELIQEMVDEANKGNITELKLIAGDLKQNLEKINHHGKRADSIVKGMLEHSRTSTGSMEPTDINALADEYLRLSYHGIRAKDKSFNTSIHTDLDNSIGKVNIIGQDIGRVLLNLYNNAFYSVNEKKKQISNGYEPAVSVTSKKSGDYILISVKDNGNGIPQNIVDKIFQPFFTTKPTGSGTGLGLSLAYDIVKAHGGELNVETKEGEETTFIISLPRSLN